MKQVRVDLIEMADVARILGRTPAAIRARVLRGQIPVAATTPRGGRLFRRSDIDAIKRTQPSVVTAVAEAVSHDLAVNGR